jgi:excisionase family DNA binding protein
MGQCEPDASEGWLTTEEAAARVGVSRHVIGRLAKSGELPAFSTPFDRRKRYFHIEDLDGLALSRPPATPWELVWAWARATIKQYTTVSLADLQERAIADLTNDPTFRRAIGPDCQAVTSYQGAANASAKDKLRDLVRQVAWAQFRGYSTTHAIYRSGTDPADALIMTREELRKRIDAEIAAMKGAPTSWMYQDSTAAP